ncbi:putative argininosuccinate lyase protein [Neofusicoccum parvum UCRNP2]|uniref:Putative argininosuccinate lyase protein n=1 Tax=Botryosphaeria parva (strain UCR-NP2) TaxID=1287680 RepID=R1EXM7_BOTPV|nr:putative argininosuccinate lyase protein [Neofusicoccum parvum UCRNP2]
MSATSVFDSKLFGNIFGTEEVRQCFSERQYVANLIEVECALAQAEGEEGIIPASAAAVIREHCHVSKIDWDLLAARTEIVGYPVLPLVEQMSKWVPEEVSGYIHWGATTQDIMDTASILQIKHGLSLVSDLLHRVAATLTTLSVRHRSTPMAGRTHLQHALPITFGYKCAVYLSSIRRHQARLATLQQTTLLVQFGGAAGTLASLGPTDAGLRVRRRLATHLSLADPIVTWHAARDGVADATNLLALVGGTLGKLALDLIVLSSSEVGEVAEPYVPHRGASSTMPQKRNPISSEVILAQSKIVRAQAGLVLDAMVADFERASGPWHLEWAAVPAAFVACVGALAQAEFALRGLEVKEGAMGRNLMSSRGLIVAEAVMMGLARHTGRQEAHEIVYRACVAAHEGDKSLREALEEVPVVVQHLKAEELAELCDPTKYLGCCELMVDELVRTMEEEAGAGKNGVVGGGQ